MSLELALSDTMQAEMQAMGFLSMLLSAMFGPTAVTYGYISPDLSRRIVSYMDPNAPSPHRWDFGAAADFVVHAFASKLNAKPMQPLTRQGNSVLPGEPRTLGEDFSPHHLAETVCALLHPMLSRVITYSESAGICMSTSTVTNILRRKNLYFNVYEGQKGAKPRYTRHRIDRPDCAAQKEAEPSIRRHGWRGDGAPTYHGRGKKQHHHVRPAPMVLLSEMLHSMPCLLEGEANHAPAPSTDEGRKLKAMAAKLSDLRIMHAAAHGKLSSISRLRDDFAGSRRDQYPVRVPATYMPSPVFPTISVVAGWGSGGELYCDSRYRDIADISREGDITVCMPEEAYDLNFFSAACGAVGLRYTAAPLSNNGLRYISLKG